MDKKLTNAEYALLGLLAEKPSHGYDLECTIEERGMRDWTELAFSSIYYVLKRLEKYGLVIVKTADSTSKTRRKTNRKTYAPTKLGFALHHQTTLKFLREPQPVYPAILLGMANWPSVTNGEACNALRKRSEALLTTQSELARKNPHQPDFVNAMFEFSENQINCELEWIAQTIKKLEKSP